MMVECPNCGESMHTQNTARRKNGAVYILYKCKSCGHNDSNRNPNLKPAKNQPTNARRFDDATIALIRTSTETRKQKAERFGCTTRKISMIERGLAYGKPAAPDAHVYTGRHCHRCRFWDLELERCREGWPDPQTYGPRYANECLDYQPSLP